MAYSDIDDIKRVLRILNVSSSNQYKVRLSDSYTIPESYSANTGTGVLKGITSISTDFAGSEFWHITFTSATAFTLYRGESDNSSDGTGLISSTFTSTSGIITIGSTQWTGTPATGDKFKFRTDSNMSEDDVDEFVADADAVIDGLLNKQMDLTSLPVATPPLIKRASIYYAANLIFTSVFSNLNVEQVPTLVRRWKTFADDMINMYLESITGNNLRKYARYGRFVSREALFDKVGVDEVAGVEGLAGEIETIDVAYDEDYDTKEAIGQT